MTRKGRNWKKGALSKIDDTLYTVERELEEKIEVINNRITEISLDAEKEEFNRDDTEELKEDIRELRSALIELSHLGFDNANEVDKLLTGSTLRNLRGEEPLAYSKSDGGAAHDAYYASQAMNRNYKYNISWRLQLDKWDEEKAEQTGPHDYDKIQVEGTHVYTNKFGGQKVHLVLDETEREPPI